MSNLFCGRAEQHDSARQHHQPAAVAALATSLLVLLACGGGSGRPNELVAVVAELPGAHCPDGGDAIETGLDTNGNGVLDPSEITSTSYVCNGLNGDAGTNGLTTLVVTTTFTAGSGTSADNAACPHGGERLESGLDTNRNGALDPSEVTSTSYVCNGLNGDAGSSGALGDAGASGLTYSVNPAVYTKGVPITPNTPSAQGTLVSYSVTPLLPPGLVLNQLTGVISGTPTSLERASDYTVTGSNAEGSTTVDLIITVNDVAPSALTYSPSTLTCLMAAACSLAAPTNSGGAVVSYSVNPQLPSGLMLNTSTGMIYGTPTTPSPVATYTVMATNSGGWTTAIVTISVTSPLLLVCVLTASGAVDPSACSDLSQTPQVVPALDFGTLLPSRPTTRTVRITNQGTAPLNFSPAPGLSVATYGSFTLGGSIAGNALAPTAHADLTITADPTSAGVFTGALNISSSDLRAPALQIPLSATVEGYQICVDNPVGLAFGQVNTGQAQSLGLTFTNCGSTPLAVNSFTFTPMSPTTSQFTISSGALPAAGSTIAVGAIIPLTVTYTPTAVQGDAAAISYVLAAGGVGLTGSVSITGSGNAAACGSPGRPNPTISMVTSYSTSQSGAYTTFDPAATPSPVVPLDWVKLSATATVSTGSPTYSWQITSQPPGSTTSLSATGNTPTVTLHTLISGTYFVTVTAKDAYGCVTTDAVTFNIVPQGKIHIELTWAEGCGDLDLHYVAPGDTVCYGNDVFYADLPAKYNGPGFPDWGCATSGGCNGAPSNPGGMYPDGTSSDDASLGIDNVTGYGPESITQNTPFTAPSGKPYQVWVYYYSNHGNCGSTHPTVNIYIDGLLRNSYTYSDSALGTFTQAVIWHVADLAVANGGTTITVSQPAVSAQASSDLGSDVCFCETPGDNGSISPYCFR